MTKTLWRANIGPIWLPYGHENHYDWTLQVAGFPLRHAGMTTNPTEVQGGSAGNLLLVDVADFSPSGGFWAKRADGTMEYMAYQSLDYGNDIVQGYSFWSSHAEQGGDIPAGSEWYQWYPVQSDNGVLDFTETLDQEFSISSYSFEINGIIGNKSLFAPHHLVAIEYSLDEGVTWGLLAQGVIRQATLQDDQKHLGAFKVRCTSMLEMTQFDNVNSQRYGEWVLNKEVNATADSTLWNISAELFSGDITGDIEGVSPSKAVDDDEETLWIGDKYVAIPELGGGKVGIVGVYFDTPSGIYEGSRFIQCKQMNNTGHEDIDDRNPRFYVYSPVNGWQWIGTATASEPRMGWLENDLSAEGHGLVVEREDEFVKAFSSATWDEIRDLQSRTTTDVFDFFKYFLPEGGAFYYRNFDRAFEEGLMWGDVTVWPGTPDNGTNPPPSMPPAPLPASPGSGYGIMYMNGAWGWYNEVNPGIPSEAKDYSWLKIELPKLSRITNEEYAAGTSYILTKTQEGINSSSGLPLVGGRVAIGNYNYSIAARDANGINLTGGLIETVLEGTPIYTVHRGQATWAYPIKLSWWSRATGRFVPNDYDEGFANIVNARNPNVSEYENDYFAIARRTGSTVQYAEVPHDEPISPDGNPSNGVRIASYYLRFNLMYDRLNTSSIAARARMNEIGFLVDEAFFADDENQDWYIDGASVQVALDRIIEKTRLGPSGSVVSGTGLYISDYVTEPGIAYPVISDLAKKGQAFLLSDFGGVVFILSGLLISRDYSSPNISRFWTANTLRAVDVEQPLATIIDYVTVQYMLSDGTTGTIEYPDEATRFGFGDKPEVGPFVVANTDEAIRIGLNYYNFTRIPYTVHVELAAGEFDFNYIRVGYVHQVAWGWAEEGVLVRNILVTAVNQHIQNGTLVTGISGIEVGRETT